MHNTSNGSSLTRGKFFLICGLASTLAYVWPYGTTDLDEKSELASSDSSAERQTELVIGNDAIELLEKRIQKYPTFGMSDALKYDPFKRPDMTTRANGDREATTSTSTQNERLPTADALSDIQEAAKLDSLDITAIYRSPRGYSAVINGEIYFVGDQLPNGHLVGEISPQSVRIVLP